MQITDEMMALAVKAYIEVDGKCRPAAMRAALSAALSVEQPTPQQLSSSIDWNNPEDPAVKFFVGYDVEGYVEHYELVGNDGEYSPNEHEKTLIEDAIRGVICELHEQLQKIVPSSPSPQTHVKALEAARYLLWYKDKGGDTNHCKEAWDKLRAALATEGKDNG